MVSTSLFFGQPIEAYLNQLRKETERHVRDIDSLDDLASSEEFVRDATAENCTLRRPAAEFDVREDDTQINVSVTIPVDGDIRLLHVSPGLVKIGGSTPTADIHQGLFASEQSTITLNRQFPPGTATDHVRAWAKEDIDLIETYLEAMQPAIDDYNARVPSEVAQLITDRKAVLQTGANLRDGLSDGV